MTRPMERGAAAAPTTTDRLHAAAVGMGAVALLPFWVSVFRGGAARISDDPDYLDFERNFPLADAYLAAVSLAAARELWRGEPTAVAYGIAGGGAGVFVGLLDVTYKARHGLYRQRSAGVAIELGWNVLTIGLGSATMVRMWRSRHRFGV